MTRVCPKEEPSVLLEREDVAECVRPGEPLRCSLLGGSLLAGAGFSRLHGAPC